MARHPISNGLVLADVEEDENEEGDGVVTATLKEKMGKNSSKRQLKSYEEKIQANADDSNAVAHTEKQYEVLLSRMTSGNLICLPSPPEDWVAPVSKVHKGEPDFTQVDNPSDWSQFTYRAKFDSKGQYKNHTIPTGVVPVPLKDGE
jgi:hypothetical protein